jgi:hypothetical protein
VREEADMRTIAVALVLVAGCGDDASLPSDSGTRTEWITAADCPMCDHDGRCTAPVSPLTGLCTVTLESCAESTGCKLSKRCTPKGDVECVE